MSSILTITVSGNPVEFIQNSLKMSDNKKATHAGVAGDLRLRAMSHALNASDSSSMSHVLPLWYAGKRPCCAALSSVERLMSRSTLSSLIVFKMGVSQADMRYERGNPLHMRAAWLPNPLLSRHYASRRTHRTIRVLQALFLVLEAFAFQLRAHCSTMPTFRYSYSFLSPLAFWTDTSKPFLTLSLHAAVFQATPYENGLLPFGLALSLGEFSGLDVFSFEGSPYQLGTFLLYPQLRNLSSGFAINFAHPEKLVQEVQA